MTKIHSDKIEQYLHDIIKLNPFDAVIILKENESNFSIEMMNESASRLSSLTYKNGMNASLFFHHFDWDQFINIIYNHLENNIYTIKDKKNQSYTVKVHMIEMNKEEKFFTIILRQDYTLVSNKLVEDNAKHLYFVEHYVDPVLTLDLNGNIVYTNLAASEKLLKNGSNFLGRNIFDLIEDENKKQFDVLFRNTIDGFPMGMPKLFIKNKSLSEEPFYIKTFPTYWNNEVIGIHIIFQNADDFFIEGSPYHLISYQDEITGLFNRKALNEHWNEKFSTYKDGLNVALLLVDLDRFKKYNESLGKNAADQMIKMVSIRLKRLCNEFCELYRYNGDEFVFIARYFSREEIEILSNKILNLFKDPFLIDGQEYFLTSSIGISLSSYGHNNDLESVLHQAEQAVYYVKRNGRFHYRFYRSEMSQAFPNEVLMEAHLKRAIEFEEFSIHLQPQIDLDTNQIDSFEALIRWNNRKFGYVPPSQFIPIAESSGLIIEIGDWILEEVCKYLQDWKQKGYRPVRVAVNISPKQFKQADFAVKIEQMLYKYEIEPKYLELEITESSMVNVQETYSILTKLKHLGVYVSVDDFGTGYSSLSYLKKYPIDIIKIDQSFIADIKKDEKNEAIIKAIISLSHHLGMDVVAEGIEEEFQEQFLKEHHCKKGQGYLYDKPLPIEQVIEEYLLN